MPDQVEEGCGDNLVSVFNDLVQVQCGKSFKLLLNA